MKMNKMIRLKHLLFGFFTFSTLLTSCISNQNITKKKVKTVSKMVEESPVFTKQFTGFVLYNPETDETLINKNGSQYFTPASNTKILTFYTAYKILGDSLPVLHYTEQDSNLIFWGTGNPLLLHPDFEVGNSAIDFLKQSNKTLKYTNENFKDARFGSGWMWGDYQGYYQVEKSSLPVYGNAMRFTIGGSYTAPLINPPYFRSLSVNKNKPGISVLKIFREEYENLFQYNLPEKIDSIETTREVPFTISNELTRKLMLNALDKMVYQAEGFQLDSLSSFNTLYEPMPDTLYRRLMQPSDNFIAEQLLLMCSDKVFGLQHTQKIIEYAKNEIMPGLPDELLWVDGSGLSRYNMFTPRSIVEILSRLHKEVPEKRLFSIFPSGGKSGSIKNWYGGNKPYVFAKTGTLRHNHCLSGYIKTNSGRTLIFSFMNNHFSSSSSEVKKEMQRILEWVRDNY
jgi:D-alanyl-D-alanine carboxypeptidase/D-alanyl-D-alanine-endopeptidase (penicillin-binding protein 4)